MHPTHLFVALTLAAATLTACNRPETTTGNRTGDAAVDQEVRDRETVALETRLDQLEREWDQQRDRLREQTSEAATRMRMAVEDDIAEARRVIADMRTTTTDNWWERQERQLGEAADDAQQDVRRFARRFTEPEVSDEVATTGGTSEWRARRDRLVRNMEARIRAMEEALEDVDETRGESAELETTRDRVKGMRDDVDRLRTASEQEWWQVTRARAEDYLERLEAAINRLADGRI